MVIYWVIIRNVAIEKSLLLEARKTLRWTVARHGHVIIFSPLCFTLIFIKRVQLCLLPTLHVIFSLPELAHPASPQ
jgi:hypothetical protein